MACRRWRDATLEAARLRAYNLAKAQAASTGAAKGRKEAKQAAAAEAINRDVQHTDAKVRELRETFEKKDPRTEVFLALRAAGRSFADASAEVERQFENQPTEGDDDHG